MGVELLEIGVKMKNGAIFTIRGCFRLVCNHPFLVGMLCFMIFLYRSSPFIFSLLVSASPILVCTAVLLGTLLSFGEPNIPEIEIEEKTTHDAVSIKSGFSGDATVVEKNERFFVERFSEKRKDLSEDSAPLIEERSREVEESNDGEIRDREFDDLMIHDGEVVENKYAPIANDEVLGSDDEKSEADSFGSEKVNVDSLDSPPRSPWTRAEDREEDEEREKQEEEDDLDDDDDDSGSDRAESSSPDASMADIMPMLDELHPLLDQEAPRPAHGSHSGSDTENHDDVEVGDDDDNEDEEDDEQGDKEEGAKSPIKWTEEDQKNLMDLGTSEIERNQRLENLILRRRARKSMSLFPERNLIDFESVDLPFNITPITTRRQNPFDLPHDSDDNNSGLPPIPGSAPSILLPRRNPFDIPYDSSEEKPDLMGDGFQEEFTTSREQIFRRHESFNVGPSVFAPNRSDVRMRPYFVPERTVSRESCFSSFQRQLSGLSDSKVSSVPDTESVTSVEDIMEDKKLLQEDLEQEKEVTENVGHGSESSSSEDSLKLGLVELQLGDAEDQSHSESVEQRYNRDSSSSSLSEVSERVFIETDGENPLILEGRREDVAEERVISTQTSVEANEIPQRYPVYDSSPRGVAPVIVKRTVSFTEGESEEIQEMLPESLSSHPVVESGTVDVVSSIREDNKRNIDFLGVDQRTEDQNVNQSHVPFEGQLKESTSMFDDKAMHEPIFKHLGEVQASTVPVEPSEDIQTRQRPNMLDIQEFDHQIFSNANSPLSPNFISISSQINFPQSDLQTIVEETDDIKEIDEGLLSELDNVGDFSVTQWESSSNEFEKRKDSVVESLSSSYHAETSTTSVEVISVEENKTEDVIYSENSRDYEDMKYITEQETSQTSIAEHIDVSRVEFDETDDQDSPDQETSEVVNHSYDDNISGISKVEVESTEAMPELEASTIEDIDMAFKQISSEEIDKPVVVESPQAEPVAVEAITEGSEMELTHETPVLEIRQIEDDATLDYESVVMEPPRAEPPVLEPPQAELVAEAVITECSEVDPTHEMSVLEARPIEDATSGYKPVVEPPQAEPVVLEPSRAEPVVVEPSRAEPPVVEPSRAEPVVVEPPQADPLAREFITEQSETDPTHETQVLEVRPIEDVALDYKPVVVEPFQAEPVALEPPQAELVAREAIIEGSETHPTYETQVLEVRSIEDATLDCKPVSVEPSQAEHVVVESPQAEPVVLESPQAEPVAREFTIENSEADPTHETRVLDVKPIEDVALDYKSVVVEPLQAETVVLEPPQADSVAREAVTKCSESDPTHEASVHEVRPTEDDGLGCETVVLDPAQAEPVAREAITEHFETDPTHETPVFEIRQIEDDATLDYKPVALEPSQAQPVALEPPQAEPAAREAITEHSETDPTHMTSVLEVRPIEEKVCSSVEESIEPDYKVESPKDLHSVTYVKEKGKLSESKSSSSSSSSSSESSSSDSDKE